MATWLIIAICLSSSLTLNSYPMFKLDSVIQLKPDERIRLVTKRHAVTILPRLVLSFLLIVVPFFFLFPMFRSGPLGIAAFVILVAAGIFIAWRTFLMWDGEALIVSNARIVKVTQAGFFSRTVTEAGLDRLSDISWKRHGLLGTLFNFGDLAINTSSQQKITASKMPSPREIHGLLVEVLDLARAKVAADESERAAKVKRIKAEIERMSDADLSALDRALDRGDRAEAIGSLFRPPAPQAIAEEDEEDNPIVVRRFVPVEAVELKPLEKTEIREIEL
jgi:hypothetical protein